MGCTPLFCCLKNFRPNVIAIIGIVANFITLIFLIWGAADITWFRDSSKALYIISLVLWILILLLLIGVLILLNMRGPNFLTFNKIGKILCLIIIAFCIITFILFLVAEILVFKDFHDFNKSFKPFFKIPGHEWAAAVISFILCLISSVIIALCANVLYKVFDDNLIVNISAYQTNNINQNSVTTIPNINPNPVVINGNNPGIVPSTVVTGNEYPVYIQQSGVNINKQ
jgi:hypothetical protein